MAWDLGEVPSKLKPIYELYYENTDALIFVVDSSDKERFELAKEELQSVMSNEAMKNAVLLILANKLDIVEACSVSEVTKKLGIEEMMKGRDWFVQGSCATTGEGIYEGLDWLGETVRRRK